MTKTIQELLQPELFIAWLETQPPEKEYIYDLPSGSPQRDGCALAKYLAANGYPDVNVQETMVYGKTGWVTLPHELDAISKYNWDELGYDGIRTFGGALNAAKEWQKALATS